jgi:hypothetical protein
MDYRDAFPSAPKLPIPARIELTEHELLMAGVIACARQASAMRDHLAYNGGAVGPANDWQQHIYGTFGEIAVAKMLDRYWTGAGVTRGRSGLADVGPLEVKWAQPGGRLVIRRTVPDARVMVLVTGWAPTFLVHGFIRAADGKRDAYLDNPGRKGEAWFVPIAALRSVDELAGVLEALLADLEVPF